MIFRIRLALIVWTVAIAVSATTALAGDAIQWQPHEAAVETAERENRGLFIQFRAEWCLYCKLMERETFRDKTLARHLNQYYVSVRVDLDEQPDIAKQYGIRRVPATVVIPPGEKPRLRIGFLSAKRLLNFLEKQNSGRK